MNGNGTNIGGEGEKCLFTLITKILPASPMNTPKPKQAKNAIKTITNSPLCIEYILI